MMQRLQFEEAQQSSYAITPARESNESRDESESESLAAEFQSLLAQIVGQVVPTPDQGTALSFALAQTVAPARIRQPEEVKAEQTDDSAQQDGQDLIGDTNSRSDGSVSSSVDNRGETFQESRQGVGESNETDTDQHLAQTGVTTVESQVVEEEITQVLQGAISEEGDLTLSNTFEEVKVSGPVVIQRAVADASDDTGGEEQVVLSNSGPHEAIDKVAERAIQTTQTVVKKEIKSDSSEEASEEELFVPTASTTADEGERDSSIKRNLGQNGQKQQISEESAHTSNGSNTASSASSPDQRQLVGRPETRTTAEGDRQNSAQHQGALDRAKKGLDKDGEPQNVSSDQSLLPVDVKRSASRNDGAIQMVLLRQAFESLRTTRNDFGDAARLRAQPQSLQAVGTAAETKSAQGEQTSRGKPLTRPQIARMMERVEATLKEAARGRDGKTLSLHLEPVDLGKVKVDVSLREGALHARIAPENQQVMQALREHAHELQGALRKLGLEVDSVTVSVTADDFAGEMTTGQETMDGRSFQEDRNNMPHERAQVLETTIGNELALRSKAGIDPERSGARNVTDHWIA